MLGLREAFALLADLLARPSVSIFLLPLMALTACGFGAEAPSLERRKIVPAQYDIASCRIPKTSGEEAIFAKLNSEEITTSDYFFKVYNRADLEAVLGASATSTSRYVSNLLGGRLFRVPREYREGERVCPMYTDLPLLPVELEPTWYSQADQLKNPDERLAGLYFEACNPEDCNDRALILPTILIDDGMDRWTLVHEMMHHNFNRERKRNPNYIGDRVLDQQGREAKDEVVRLFEFYDETKSTEALRDLAERLNWLVRVYLKESLVNSFFEEVAIEGQLVDEFAADRLKNVAPEAAQNAIWYMRTSSVKGLKIFTDKTFNLRTLKRQMSARDLLDFVQDEATSRGLMNVAREARASQRSISTLERRAQELIERGERRLRVLGFNIQQEGPPIAFPFGIRTMHGLEASSHADHLPAAKSLEDWLNH